MSGPMKPVVTGGVLVETSLGSFVVDLFGLDAPSVSGNFVNNVRAQLFHGAVATEVVPEVAIFFSHAADSVFDSLLGQALTSQGGGSVSNSFWQLIPDATAPRRSQLEAAALEGRLCKRRQCTGISRAGSAEFSSYATGTGSLGKKGLLIVEASKLCNESDRDGMSSSVFRFGITLSDKPMEFLEGQYVAVGSVREGGAALQAMRRSPHSTNTNRQESAYVAGTPAWPRPLKMIRIKRMTVLPTSGTGVYLGNSNNSSSSATDSGALGHRLHTAGCFRYWASQEDILRATARLTEIVSTSQRTYNYKHPLFDQQGSASATPQLPQPLVVLGGNDGNNSATLIDYNPHYAGEYLSSDDEGADEAHATGLSRKERVEMQEAKKRVHQEKANETLSLMLNVLNGVADVSGDMKPPDNVLFVCKLNPATTSEGLSMCFSQFGNIVSADVVYDKQTKQSLCYGFVEFETAESCFRAFQKMDKALVDDCRIHVDFSQSVSKLWFQKKKELRKRARD